jgi:hypothetical protein
VDQRSSKPTRKDIVIAFSVDYERGQLFWKSVSKYHCARNGREAGYARDSHTGKKYWVIRWNGKSYKRGHIIFFLGHDRWPSPCLDHINGDSLDDRPENLREATFTENAWNHRKRAKRSALPMGVRQPHVSSGHLRDARAGASGVPSQT